MFSLWQQRQGKGDRLCSGPRPRPSQWGQCVCRRCCSGRRQPADRRPGAGETATKRGWEALYMPKNQMGCRPKHLQTGFLELLPGFDRICWGLNKHWRWGPGHVISKGRPIWSNFAIETFTSLPCLMCGTYLAALSYSKVSFRDKHTPKNDERSQ